ncbi:Ig-like domain-containing protein [Agromyces aerolatus]|uniref:Ig-like domain-containing protein n=1 Tax=Agromyces sp. LY-1074 TaxID=3074080 RepID=UPI00285CB7D6|nr:MULTISPECIES: Ig-like domain-containing protein [unclassified Agromyces]MDR5701705.1 Ig-like domain-containing protein [Agromyces sp. LY-1074]MDR5707948.1 Ig-like domain-containing protein [Agromyces sp. LY-1358]
MARLVPNAFAPAAARRSRRRSNAPLVRRLGAVLAALTLAVTSAVMLPAAATAAPNPAIVVGDVTVTSSDGEQATVGDTLTVSGSWDATTADPHVGDTFTVGLPIELAFDQAVPFTLDGPDPGGQIQTWANCLTDPATGIATCTLTPEVELYPELVHGTFEFDVEPCRRPPRRSWSST